MIRLAVAAAAAVAAVWLADDVETLWSRPDVERERARLASWLSQPAETDELGRPLRRSVHAEATRPTEEPSAVGPQPDPMAREKEAVEFEEDARPVAEGAPVDTASRAWRIPESPASPGLDSERAAVDEDLPGFDVPTVLSAEEARRIRYRLERVMSVARRSEP